LAFYVVKTGNCHHGRCQISHLLITQHNCIALLTRGNDLLIKSCADGRV